MRFVALALIPLALPLFIVLLNTYREKRDLALLAIGMLMFLIGTLSTDAAIITWRMWQGYSRGIFISLVDMLALALIFTRAKSRARIPLLGLMFVYLLPSTLSLAVSKVPMATFFVSWQVLRIIVMFIALAGELQRLSALRSLCTGVALGLMVQAGYVIQQKLSGVVQASGTAEHQNILGMMVVMAIVPLMAMVLEGEKRPLPTVGILAGLIVVAGGGSRATMGFALTAVVLVLVLSIWRRPTARKGKIFGLALVASLVFVPLGFATLKDRFGDSGISVETEEDQRPLFEAAAKAIARDYPFGTGANTYVTIANTEGYNSEAGVGWYGANLRAPVHNSYLLMRAEMGWHAQIVMMVMLIVPIVGGMRVAFADRKSPLSGMGISSAVVATVTALHCNFEYAWHLENVQRVYFMNLAILSACLMVARNARSASRKNVRAAARNPQAGGSVPPLPASPSGLSGQV